MNLDRKARLVDQVFQDRRVMMPHYNRLLPVHVVSKVILVIAVNRVYLALPDCPDEMVHLVIVAFRVLGVKMADLECLDYLARTVLKVILVWMDDKVSMDDLDSLDQMAYLDFLAQLVLKVNEAKLLLQHA